jgi:hypothetical protein
MTDVVTADELTSEEKKRLEVLLGNPLFFPDAFKDYLAEKIRTEVGAKLPLEQARKSNTLFGKFVFVHGKTTSADQTWEDMNASDFVTVPGPGKAMVFWTSASSPNGASFDTCLSAVSVNGATPDQNEAIWMRGVSPGILLVPGARAQLVDLPSASNTIKIQVFKYGTATYSFSTTYMLVVRIEL